MSTMSHACVFALVLGVAMAAVPEWKGIFLTPEATYKWGAQKKMKNGQLVYADATMKMAMIPVAGATSQALTGADSAGKSALALAACPEVTSGSTMVPAENTCFKLVFDQVSNQSMYTIDATNAGAIAFFTEHFPTEFENTDHYLKDTTGVDIEPVAQDPVPTGGHDHGVGTVWKDEFEGKCVCQGAANNWKLDCSKKAVIEAAVTALDGSTACGKENPPQSCKNNYYVMQAHHDHCLHDQLPTGIEKKLHAYEHFYDDCFVKRQYNAQLQACPAVDCSDATKLTNAIATLQAAAVTAEACAQPTHAAAIKTVLMAHDTCPEDKLPNNLEVALHDYEEACEAQLCNSAGGPFNPYDDKCSASVASSGFGFQDTLLVTTWVLPLAVLISW